MNSIADKIYFSFRWQPEPGPLVETRLLAEGKRTTRVQIIESGELEDTELSALAWRNGLKLLSDLAQSYYGQ